MQKQFSRIVCRDPENQDFLLSSHIIFHTLFLTFVTSAVIQNLFVIDCITSKSFFSEIQTLTIQNFSAAKKAKA